jgi:hypothetical protein
LAFLHDFPSTLPSISPTCDPQDLVCLAQTHNHQSTCIITIPFCLIKCLLSPPNHTNHITLAQIMPQRWQLHPQTKQPTMSLLLLDSTSCATKINRLSYQSVFHGFNISNSILFSKKVKNVNNTPSSRLPLSVTYCILSCQTLYRSC